MNSQEVESYYSESHGSSFDNESLQEVKGKKCYICGKSSLFQLKKICKFCNRVICSEHSQKHRKKPGYDIPQRICTACEEKIVIKEIKEEIDKEIERLGKKIMQGKLLKESLKLETASKDQSIEELLISIEQEEKILKNIEEELSKKLKDEAENGEKIRTDTEFLRKCLDERIENERVLVVECNGKENQLQILITEEEELRNANLELGNQINESYEMLKESVLKEELVKTLCQRCLAHIGI